MMGRYNWGAAYTPDVSDDSPGVSKYNSAQLINQRMHNLWLECSRAWKNGDMKQLNDMLDVVYTELFADATKEQKQKIREYEKALSNDEIQMKICRDPRRILKLKSEYVHKIKNKWLFLKAMEKKQGIGKAYRDESEDDFE